MQANIKLRLCGTMHSRRTPLRIAIRTSFCKVTKGVHNSYCSPSALNLELVDLYERQLGMPFLPQNPCSLCCHLTNFKGYFPFSYLSKCKSNLRNESFVIFISPILFLFCPILTAKVWNFGWKGVLERVNKPKVHTKYAGTVPRNAA